MTDQLALILNPRMRTRESFLQQNVRPDGRKLLQGRPLSIQNDESSVLIQMGDTQVLAAVTLQVGHVVITFSTSEPSSSANNNSSKGDVVVVVQDSTMHHRRNNTAELEVQSWLQESLRQVLDLEQLAISQTTNQAFLLIVTLEILNDDGTTKGRPTWVEWAADGSLLVSDDTAGIIWRVSAPDAAPQGAIERVTGRRLPPQRELRGQNASFGEDDFAREVPAN